VAPVWASFLETHTLYVPDALLVFALFGWRSLPLCAAQRRAVVAVRISNLLRVRGGLVLGGPTPSSTDWKRARKPHVKASEIKLSCEQFDLYKKRLVAANPKLTMFLSDLAHCRLQHATHTANYMYHTLRRTMRHTDGSTEHHRGLLGNAIGHRDGVCAGAVQVCH
jgi:hypothetical protein